MTDLSVVVPVYNESAVVAKLVGDLERHVVARTPSVEVIVVDDCSTDGSGAILEELALGGPWLTVERARKNAGHGPSASCAARAAPPESGSSRSTPTASS